MEFVCYTDLAELPDSASRLFEKAAHESIFFSKPWFENLLENGLDEGENTLFACVVDGDQVLGILPLRTHENGYYQSLKHLYSSLSTLIVDRNKQQEILSCLANGLRELGVQSLHLDPVAEDDKTLHALKEVMQNTGYSSERHFRFRNWFHRVDGVSFSEYMDARPSRVRNTIARKRRKLEREHEYHIRLFTDNDSHTAVDDFSAVYSASWKANELHGAFIEGLAEHLSHAGWLRIAVLYIDEQPAAAQFWFVAGAKASIFKLAYDEKWKQYSPGSILIAWLMEYVIDSDKVEEIDFLTGNDAYKQDWMSQRRDRWRLSFIITNPISKQRFYSYNPLKPFLKWLKDRVYNRHFHQQTESGYATDNRHREI